MKKLSLLICLLIYAALPQRVCGQVNIITDNFNTAPITTGGWTNPHVSGGAATDKWKRATAATAAYPSSATWPTNPGPYAGSGMAWFNSYSFSTGSIADLTSPALSFTLTASGEYRVSFWMYRGDNFGFFYDQLNVYVSTTTSSAAGTLLGTVNLDISQSPAVSSEGWYQYTFTVPASYSGATNYIIFEGYSDFGYDILVDDVSVDYYANCTGAPTAGSSVVTPGSGGVGTSFTLSLSGATSGAGITYQWQSGPSATGPWTNISGATTATYTLYTHFNFVNLN